jgi:hypothetical protein
MACKKYVLTNTTSSTQTFSYQECSNSMWVYDALLEPNQTKTIWLLDSTFQSYYTNDMTIVDEGVFPPSASPTPSVTTTPTPTPSVTTTPTPTPSVTPSGTSSVTPTPSATTTPTVTPSVTPSGTASVTPTPTITPSATPSFNFEVLNTNTVGAYIEGITATTGSIITKSGYSYPVNEGDTLYADYVPSVNDLDFDIQIKDPSNLDYLIRVEINSSTSQTLIPGPGDWFGIINITGVIDSDVITITLEDN